MKQKKYDYLFVWIHFSLCMFIITTFLFLFKLMFPEGFTSLTPSWLNTLFNVIYILIFGIAGIGIYFILGSYINKLKGGKK